MQQILKVKSGGGIIKFGSVLVNDFWTSPPIKFVHDEISKLVFIYYYLGLEGGGGPKNRSLGIYRKF